MPQIRPGPMAIAITAAACASARVAVTGAPSRQITAANAATAIILFSRAMKRRSRVSSPPACVTARATASGRSARRPVAAAEIATTSKNIRADAGLAVANPRRPISPGGLTAKLITRLPSRIGTRRLDDPIPQRRFQQDHGNNNVIAPQC